MITIRFSGRVPSPRTIEIGQETDSNAEKLRFLLPQVGSGQAATMQMIFPDGTADAINITDGMITLPASALDQAGRIRAWVEILAENTVAWHSELFFLDVGELPPISEAVEQQYPTALQQAMTVTEANKTAAAASAALAEAAAAYAAASSGQASFTFSSAGHLIVTWTDTQGTSHSTDVGPVSAYAIAVAAGYTGTAEQFATDMGNSASNASSAAADAIRAETAADSVTVASVTETKSYLGIA